MENVKSYYDPLIEPQEISRHYLWASFAIHPIDVPAQKVEDMRHCEQLFGFDLRLYNMPTKKKGTLLKNCVHPKLGLHILKSARNAKSQPLERWS